MHIWNEVENKASEKSFWILEEKNHFKLSFAFISTFNGTLWIFIRLWHQCELIMYLFSLI